MLFPHFHFSSKENRLIGFSGTESPEQSEPVVEKVEKSVDAQKPTTPELVRGQGEEKVDQAGEKQKEASGTLSAKEAKIAQLKTRINGDKAEVTKLEGEVAAEKGKDGKQEDGPKKPGDNPEASKEKVDPKVSKLSKSLQGLKMSKKDADSLAAGLVALGEFMKTFKETFGLDKKKLDTPDAANKDKPPEGGDNKPKGKEGPKSSVESNENSVKMVQNPKEEADKIGDVESKEKDLEKQIDVAGDELAAGLDGDTSAAERTALMKTISDLNDQLTKVEEQAERKGELLDEQTRRNEFIDSAWDRAVGTNPDVQDGDRIASSIKLEGGDDLVIALNGDAPESLVSDMKAAGLDVSLGEKSITISNVPPNIFDESGNAILDKTFKALASGIEKDDEESAESKEDTEEAPEGMNEKQTTKVRKVLEANRQDVEEEYGKVEGNGVEKRDAARGVVDALNAEIDFLESQDASPMRNIDGQEVSLVDRLKEKRTNYTEKVKTLSKDLPATKADPDDIPDNSEQYARKRVEEYRRTKEDAYAKDPSRKNAQLVIDAVDAELAYLKDTDQNPERSDTKGSIPLQDRLETKKEEYRSKLEKGGAETSEEEPVEETEKETVSPEMRKKNKILTGLSNALNVQIPALEENATMEQRINVRTQAILTRLELNSESETGVYLDEAGNLIEGDNNGVDNTVVEGFEGMLRNSPEDAINALADAKDTEWIGGFTNATASIIKTAKDFRSAGGLVG